MYIIVHNCHTQHSTEQFWLSSLLSSRQAPELRCCLLEGRGKSREILWRSGIQRYILLYCAQRLESEARAIARWQRDGTCKQVGLGTIWRDRKFEEIGWIRVSLSTNGWRRSHQSVMLLKVRPAKSGHVKEENWSLGWCCWSAGPAWVQGTVSKWVSV